MSTRLLPKASPAQKSWNGGKTGKSRAAHTSPVVTHCTDLDCGTAAAGHPLPEGWQGATVDGTRRRYCSTWCATYAQALADIRSIPAPEATR